MEPELVVKALAALAHTGRLAVFRLLIKAADQGLAAGVIAHTLAVPANTLSAQLTVLSNAGLIRGRRNGRSIIYAADMAAVSDLLGCLTEDCCGGHGEISPGLAGTAHRCVKQEPI